MLVVSGHPRHAFSGAKRCSARRPGRPEHTACRRERGAHLRLWILQAFAVQRGLHQRYRSKSIGRLAFDTFILIYLHSFHANAGGVATKVDGHRIDRRTNIQHAKRCLVVRRPNVGTILAGRRSLSEHQIDRFAATAAVRLSIGSTVERTIGRPRHHVGLLEKVADRTTWVPRHRRPLGQASAATCSRGDAASSILCLVQFLYLLFLNKFCLLSFFPLGIPRSQRRVR